MRRIKKGLKYLLTVGLIVVLLILLCDAYVAIDSRKHIYTELESLPDMPVGLVLGTSKYVKGGRKNLFFEYRMDAAAALYKNGKIRHLIVSGDNHTRYYDEATAMKKALIERGIPPAAITRDYAGFRTFDSVIRCREVFGQDAFTVISQEFHNMRAVFIARSKGMDAIAFNARGVSKHYAPRTYLREYLARVKAVLDVHILGTRPRFLGEPVEIPA